MVQDCDLLEELEEKCSDRTDEVTRRRFLRVAGAAASITPAAPFLMGDSPDPGKQENPPKPRSRSTLFFNFSHEPDHTTAEYYALLGSTRYHLRRLSPYDVTLSRERSSNTFLQLVPDSALTHVLEGAPEPPLVQVGYTVKNPDTTGGTWSLSSMFTQIPTTGLTYACLLYTSPNSNGHVYVEYRGPELAPLARLIWCGARTGADGTAC